MRRFHATLSSFAVFALAGCAGLQVETEYDPEASLTQLSTYDWVDQEADPTGDPAVDSPLLKRHIRAAVEGELGRMGYRKVTSEIPDLRIAYTVIAEERIYGSYGYGSGYGRYGYGGPYGYRGSSYRGSFGFSLYGGRYLRPYYGSYYGYPGAGYGGAGGVRAYLQGTLVLDIIDVRTEEVIFRGWARESLHSDPSPKRVRMYVTEAVEKILEDFPRAGSASGPLVATP
ncbi:MAG: DUF4136 domain-containing protein [Gemmatimonadetes bacterium]|nr:DUF4136 domain-containing protein [Gemmatimonadota bacterium]